MYFLDFVDFQVAGASPEPLLTVSGRHVSTRPIAGTRPRGADAEEDARIAAELLADEKERAEHVMLVDLGRNDLGRVCEYGSVAVDTFMAVETYSHVMHIVSSVSGDAARGRRRDGRAALGAARRARCRGAPKVRAMQIIDELEPVKRGGYGGAIGYLGYARRPRHLHPHPHRRASRTAWRTSRPAAARSPTPSPTTSTRSRAAKARGRACARSSWRCAQADWP